MSQRFNLVGVYKDQDVSGWWASEKLDGVRGYWDGKKLTSKQGNTFDPPKWWTDLLPDEALDGELYLGRGKFDEGSGIVRTKGGDAEWKKIRFHIFDLPKGTGAYEARQDKLRKLVERERKKKGSPLRYVKKKKIKDGAAAKKMAKHIIAKGGEGVVLHRPGSKYLPGDSKDLLKIKGFQDAEAFVRARIPGKGRNAGRMGALEVEDAKTGQVYKVGGGFSDQQRDRAAKLFPKGTQITVRFTSRTKSGLPRHGRFLRIRDDEPRSSNPQSLDEVRRRVLDW